MLRASFYGFSTAQRALAASQKALDVTGQNMANINTNGYTRQRLDLYSSPSGGFADRYMSRPSNNVGQGVVIGGVSQIRDPFLDVRFRKEATKLGEMEGKLSSLEDMSGIFDEISVKGLGAQISDFIKQLQTLSNQTGNSEFDGIVKASAEVLTKLFGQYAKQTEGIRTQQTYEIENVTVPDINKILVNISNLSKSIREDQIHGNSSLELLDQRNTLIDELSTYMNINVQYDEVELAPGVVVRDLRIDLVGATGNTPLIDGEKYGEFSATTDPTTKQTSISYGFDNATPTDITGEINTGLVKGYLDMLNSGGEFDTPPNSIRGIAYYEKMLDTVANQLATEFNAANNRGVDPTGTDDHPLFGTSDGSKIITAKNISIAEGWKNNSYGIHNTEFGTGLPGDNSGARDNIQYMISLFNKKMSFSTSIIDPATAAPVQLFNGTFQECFAQIGTVLALDIKSTNALADNYASVLNGVHDLKDSISGVSLDEEGINLLRYQKSYNAAARLMTTLDEALDTIINGMGRVGR